jgi:hypothetical protein
VSRAVKIRNTQEAVQPAIVHPRGACIIQSSYLPDSLKGLVTMFEPLRCVFPEELNLRRVFCCRRCCRGMVS